MFTFSGPAVHAGGPIQFFTYSIPFIFDTSELAELWSEEHIAELPTFDNFHNIHQVKLEEALDGLSAKLFKNPEDKIQV